MEKRETQPANTTYTHDQPACLGNYFYFVLLSAAQPFTSPFDDDGRKSRWTSFRNRTLKTGDLMGKTEAAGPQ